MKTLRWIAAVATAALLLAACSSSSSTPSSSTATSGSTPTATGSTSAPATANSQLEVTAPVGAANTGYQETELSAPADTDLEIAFLNDDAGIPHNIQIFEGTSASGTPIWAPENDELINGVATVTYEVPGLAAGTYTFNCLAHPATMLGTLTVA